MMIKYTLGDLADFLSANLQGDAKCVITGIAPLDKAISGQITFLENPSYRKYLTTTQASAVILTAEHAKHTAINVLVVPNPYLSYAKLSKLFDNAPKSVPGIHSTVVIGENCNIDSTVSIAPYCVIGNSVTIGKNVCIGAGSIIGDEAVISEDSILKSKVVLYHKVKIGKRVILHSGVVIGSDGFGNGNDKGKWVKIYQLGSVILGDDVEVGANTTIDRGALEDTIIADGVKLDNQIQIGHNVCIGAHTAIAGCVGIAGSTKIGSYCMIGGGVGINGHIEIADKVVITGMSGISKSITESGIYSSGIPVMPHRAWWRILARLAQIEKLNSRVSKLEKENNGEA
jgi:UDP-3-O-[3-hydroxymyristoyl] glucosamine N-acyltransferase